MSFDEEELLILEVQKREPLWNFQLDVKQRNAKKRNKLWQEVSDALNGKNKAGSTLVVSARSHIWYFECAIELWRLMWDRPKSSIFYEALLLFFQQRFFKWHFMSLKCHYIFLGIISAETARRFLRDSCLVKTWVLFSYLLNKFLKCFIIILSLWKWILMHWTLFYLYLIYIQY